MTGQKPDLRDGLNATMMIGAVGVVVAVLLGMLAPHDGAVWKMPGVLEERVSEALSAAGYPGLEIDMHGQRAVLRGIVADEADVDAARRAALTAAGAGGSWAGGVTSVDASGVTVGMIEQPYAWSARREEARIVLTGAVPSEPARTALVAVAHEAFPTAEIVNEMHVAGGAASSRFTDLARDAVRSLAQLNSGEVRVVDSHIVFIGDGGQAAVSELQERFGEPPAPFRSRLAVTTDGLDLQHPELQGLNLASGDAETCERAFERMMERNIINFAPGSAAIDPSSRAVLNALATVALRCDRFSIEVAGHTDNQGSPELNGELSQRRADAVAAYLAAQGVARSRLSARGYGAERPRASNASEAGQAANRRIEFYVGAA